MIDICKNRCQLFKYFFFTSNDSAARANSPFYNGPTEKRYNVGHFDIFFNPRKCLLNTMH